MSDSNETVNEPVAAEPTPTFAPSYKYYALGVLFIGYVINFIDRSILAILLEPIKEELLLNDTQLGLLGGLAFAMFYATLGIPIAALADRWSRVKVLSISMVIWSAMTAVCGLANSFWHLLIARIGVGIGEAGASPPSHSLISDYFPIESRATALSIYALGIPFGSMVGNAVGGWGAATLGWRDTFFLVGLPGIAVAALIFITLREPPRGMSEAPSAKPMKDEPSPSMGKVLGFLWDKVSFRHMSFASGLHAFVSYSAGTWNSPFLIRVHDMPIEEVGYWLALIAGVGAIGTFFGGYLADKFFDRTGDRRWYLWIPGLSTLVMVPFQFVAYLYDGVNPVIFSLGVVAILGSMYLGPAFAMTQALVTLRMRAVASAILLLVLNLIGMGLGPFVVGIFSDLLEPATGHESIRYAMCIALIVNIWAGIHFMLGARSLQSDLDATEQVKLDAEAAA